MAAGFSRDTNLLDGSHHADSADSAFTFEGNWQDFARIALPNLLLTIVTLGIYRFWATARERRYLWSRTRFVDEHLEWAGTGMELFAGFVIVLVLFGVPYFGVSFVSQALIARGYEASYMWKTAVGWLPLGLLLPWSMTSLWNERWSKMSFGPFAFRSDGEAGGVFARFLLFYLAPFVLFVGGVIMAGMGMLAGYGIGGENGVALGGSAWCCSSISVSA